MPEHNEFLIGQLALERKLITPEQLREALKGEPKLLGVTLVAKGYLTDEQLVALIDEQRRQLNQPADYAEIRKGDILFGKLVVKDGRATEEQVSAALRRQQELAEQGSTRRLGEILGLSASGVQATLRQQNKTLMACPACGARFNVVGPAGEKAFPCKKCGATLEIATAGAGADETAFHLPAVKKEPAAEDPKNRFGKYVLVRQVGQGGFGAVYRAYEKGLGRTVALKFLHSENPEDVQRFVREAQTAAQLTHPNIVPLHEVGEAEGKHYIAMEFIEGQTLDKLRVEPKKALAIMRDVAVAVHYAHEKGIIHRDLKPQNLMVSGDHVWVMDFGLARQLKGGTTLTLSGTIVGTPSYMPPEQAEGKRCDERSDVYSLGATLYELVTGHPAFEGAEPLTILDRVRREDPIPPRKYNPRVDPEVETIIAKAMEKDPSRRYAAAKEFANDLRRHLEGEPILARPSSLVARAAKWMKRHRAVAAVSAVILAGLLALAGFLTFDSMRFRAKIRDLEARAKGAEEGRRFGEAAGLWREIRTLLPTHAQAEEREIASRVAEKREAAEAFLTEGRQAQRDYAAFSEALARRRDDEKKISAEIEPYEGEAKKAPLWKIQKEIEEQDEKAAVRYTDMLVAFTSALAVDPGREDARSALAALYFAEYERAERENDALGMKVNERLVLFFGKETYASRMARRGTIEIDSNPPGAMVELWRYEEGPDRRLVARLVRSLGACPTPTMPLEAGSYLLILKQDGCRDARYPVLVGRGTEHKGKLNLYTDEQIGKEFVYVPAGKFVMGGDKEAYSAGPRNADAQTGDFAIASVPVTCEEYAEFLNDRAYHTVESAALRGPRLEPKATYRWKKNGEKIDMPANVAKRPVWGISWEDAQEYCRWRSKREGGGIRYRLLLEAEWEKAARGADGRFFPWGNHFDWSFTRGHFSLGAGPGSANVGAFEKDESPYGVHDMAGGLRTWCEDWFNEKADAKCSRGGAWSYLYDAYFRSATRYGLGRTSVDNRNGFRVAHSLPPR